VITTIATLAALLLPALTRAKGKAYQATCLSNLRQLGLAWALYNDDNADRLVQSYSISNLFAWVQGDMKDPSQAVDADLIKAGLLYNYNQNTRIYHCPTDPGVTIGGTRLPSVRSYSMNSFMGDRPAGAPPNPDISFSGINYVPDFPKLSEVPDPSTLFVFIDEDERSISGGDFVTSPPGLVWSDGHGIPWHFVDPQTAQVGMSGTEGKGNLDLQTLAAEATVPVQ
jgi:hypothetical protein